MGGGCSSAARSSEHCERAKPPHACPVLLAAAAAAAAACRLPPPAACLFMLRLQHPAFRPALLRSCLVAEQWLLPASPAAAVLTTCLLQPPAAAAAAEGKPIPTELRREEAELRRQVAAEDDNTAVPRTHIDDEYAHAGERDPKILITTSRDPSSRLVQFAKEVKLLLPNSQRVNRGSMVRARARAGTGAAEGAGLARRRRPCCRRCRRAAAAGAVVAAAAALIASAADAKRLQHRSPVLLCTRVGACRLDAPASRTPFCRVVSELVESPAAPTATPTWCWCTPTLTLIHHRLAPALLLRAGGERAGGELPGPRLPRPGAGAHPPSPSSPPYPCSPPSCRW